MECLRLPFAALISKKQLSSMELEARVMPDVTRKELGDRITQYRSTLSDLSKSLEAARSTVEKSSLVERDVAVRKILRFSEFHLILLAR